MKVLEAYSLLNNTLEPLKLGEFFEDSREWGLLDVYDIENASILGFGGCCNETSAYNYSLLTEKNKEKVIKALFSDEGLAYNFCRLCIGSSDFYLRSYCYVDDNDFDLKTFSIDKDKEYVIPFIKDALKCRNGDIKFLASPWSPPAWMKTNNERLHGGHLKPEYYELYAEYLCKYLFAYKKEGINIEYLTMQNEQKATQTWESCVFNIDEEISFAKVFKKVSNSHGLNIKLLCWDHNKERLVQRAIKPLSENDLFYGAAYHWYSGDYFDSISAVRKLFPNKVVMGTEFCKASVEDSTVSTYVNEYINDLRQGSSGLIEWLLLSDKKGGPFHDRVGGCTAPITYTENGEFEFSTNYNQTWIFSHFIPVNSVSLHTSSFNEDIKISAVKTPDNKIVINIYNTYQDVDFARLYIKGMQLDIPLKKNASYVIVIK